MDKAIRNAIERATQQGRRLLDEDFSSQLEGTFDVLRTGVIATRGGAHLSVFQQSQRDKIVAAIEHKRAAGMPTLEAVTDYVRDAAFTTLNRFIALKMLEARELVQECITKGEQSAGYREFCGMAPGIALLPNAAGYRLYIESLFDEFSTEIKVLFDRRDAASVLWPKRQTFEELLAIFNAPDLCVIWSEDETIGWVYQFFNSKEERQAMRDPNQGGSHAPRNSREMAVRNQFFTPRYVVQFLTDNTLGRLWLEMHGDKTRLNTICEYFIRAADEPVHSRPRKDPRDLRVLDPACGSGHFLLYSFDLLLTIYEEAWAAEATVPTSEATGRTLREDYPDLMRLRHAAPKLIVEHNLYGVDIDPRCAQIAALALWLRAQRAWKDLGMASSERPRIHRTHIVVAEPMPGDTVLVDEFATRLDPPLLRDLFKKMVGESRLAGELGALLRVENGIATELRYAREQFVNQRQSTNFLPGMEPVIKQGSLDLSGIDDDRFFHEAEALIIEALRGFAEASIGGVSVRRRLFAGDAAQGIALIDLVRTKFDVVLMNPPFGACSLPAKKEFEKGYPRTKNDVYAAFVERGIQLLHSRGLLGAITSRTGFFLSSFQKWREDVLLKEAPPVVVADLGYGVMDSALVSAAAYCLEKMTPGGCASKTVFLKAVDVVDKESVLRTGHHTTGISFEIDSEIFLSLPRSPFAYWAPERMFSVFKEYGVFERDGRTAKQGLATGSDERFIRVWWEVAPASLDESHAWVPLVKGGAPSPFYIDPIACVKWIRNGAELKAFVSHYRASRGWGDQWSAMINASERYFEPGFTWSLRALRFAPAVMPSGCAFSTRGCAGLAEPSELRWLIPLLNSDCFDVMFKVLLGGFDRPEYTTGALQEMPIPDPPEDTRAALDQLFLDGWRARRSQDRHVETAHAFVGPELSKLEKHGDDLQKIQDRINSLALPMYGLVAGDLQMMDQHAGSSDEAARDSTLDEDDDIEQQAAPELDIGQLPGLSWLLGVAFGRFDPRLATGERPEPLEPEPFATLPPRSPAMWPENEEPADHADILVDDEGHNVDLVACIRAIAERVHVELPQNLRGWFAKEFFPLHIKMYSKSRRKAPIYWQLATPSANYSVWLYLHAFSKDTLFRVQNDYVAPKLAHEERRHESLSRDLREKATAAQRKELAAQEELVEELRSLLEEVKRVAPLWNPNLDDGVVISFAPLWRLVPQHKSWQRELKSKWGDLAAGKYDWAHLAMHLWPERVIPKCATDRSLAIAHGLEDVFWAEGDDGKWKPRPTPTRSVAELVRERTSIAVKAALKSLLEAPVANANGGRGRGRRFANAAADGGAR